MHFLKTHLLKLLKASYFLSLKYLPSGDFPFMVVGIIVDKNLLA
jgi:hypothetical protein